MISEDQRIPVCGSHYDVQIATYIYSPSFGVLVSSSIIATASNFFDFFILARASNLNS
jgi:hypothetical protein